MSDVGRRLQGRSHSRSGRLSGIVGAAVLLASFGCHSTPQEPAPPPPAPTPPGGCNNECVNGTCTFLAIRRVDPTPLPPGVPSRPLAPDASLDAGGDATFELQYEGPPPSKVAVYARLSAPASAQHALETFFQAHREALCGGEIIRVPCPPGNLVTVNVPTPPVGTLLP